MLRFSIGLLRICISRGIAICLNCFWEKLVACKKRDWEFISLVTTMSGEWSSRNYVRGSTQTYRPSSANECSWFACERRWTCWGSSRGPVEGILQWCRHTVVVLWAGKQQCIRLSHLSPVVTEFDEWARMVIDFFVVVVVVKRCVHLSFCTSSG